MLISCVTSVPPVLMFFKLKRTKKADADQYKPYSSIDLQFFARRCFKPTQVLHILVELSLCTMI